MEFHAELSVDPAGSSVESPVANVAVAPPTRDAVPRPMEGVVEPVVVNPSGGTLLKFHCAMMPGGVTFTDRTAKVLVTLPA